MVDVFFRQNPQELAEIASRIIEKNILAVLREKESAVFGICGGRSVSGIFKLLLKRNIPWSKVHVFLVDERMVLISDAESNFKLAQENFLAELIFSGRMPKENVHPFIVEKGIADYEAQLKKCGGNYDIVLLSSGEDGHIGALYPRHHSVFDDSEYFIMMNDSPKFPPERMSASRKLLLRSKAAVILFFGESKRNALKMFFDKKIEYKDCPAKLVERILKVDVMTNIQR